MKIEEIIDTQEEFEKLRSLCGKPSIRAANKVIPQIDKHCRDFISMSPFLALGHLIRKADVMFHQGETPQDS